MRSFSLIMICGFAFMHFASLLCDNVNDQYANNDQSNYDCYQREYKENLQSERRKLSNATIDYSDKDLKGQKCNEDYDYSCAPGRARLPIRAGLEMNFDGWRLSGDEIDPYTGELRRGVRAPSKWHSWPEENRSELFKAYLKALFSGYCY